MQRHRLTQLKNRDREFTPTTPYPKWNRGIARAKPSLPPLLPKIVEKARPATAKLPLGASYFDAGFQTRRTELPTASRLVWSARMPTLVPELAEFIVKTLELSDVDATSLDDKTVLFGEGLGLDSIDALELTQALTKAYGVKIAADDDKNRTIFATLGSLATFVAENRAR